MLFQLKDTYLIHQMGGKPLSTNIGNVYCCEHGGELKSQADGKEITHYYYKSSSGNLGKKYAYALYNASDAAKQRIIWNSNLSDNASEPIHITDSDRALLNYRNKLYKC